MTRFPPELFDRCDLALRIEPPGFDPAGLTDIQWRADACTPGSVLCFQRFDDGRSDAEIVERYLIGSPFALLVINRPLDCFDRLPGRAIHVTAPGAWGATLKRLCDHCLPLAPGDWQIAAVTGTNGKTTTVKYLEAMLLAEGRRVLGIGTLGLALNGKPEGATGFTSPPYIELRRLLTRYRDRADTLVMEMSSHALHQERVYGLELAAAAWTNFTQDHLDYHGTEAEYFAAKARILDLLRPGTPLLTTSPAVAERLRAVRGADVPVRLMEPARPGHEALRRRPFLALDYNRANLALAEAMAERLLARPPAEPWRALAAVDGRFACRTHGRDTFVVDFAHTPDALDNVLAAIRAGFPEARIMTLFGCGGDRDRGKRPLMGAAVCRHSDRVILTSDNPRHEPPEAIIEDVLRGTGDCPRPPEVIVDRAAAIRHAFDCIAAEPRPEPGQAPGQGPWVLLIAGKGHERYIDQGGQKRYFSDQDELDANMARLGWDG
ncbi:MAG: UDP-N-acetylmuramoyl-L-alanyl-D-glutamate--2,6-diaminopimelate ligase [Thiohalocapsa sp.]|nr:UDP-N-acetylmuramoyl-L-alanyl-D-glutamate--2,6-diaminopimelate ligase [Thiohalocapsa sp.]